MSGLNGRLADTSSSWPAIKVGKYFKLISTDFFLSDDFQWVPYKLCLIKILILYFIVNSHGKNWESGRLVFHRFLLYKPSNRFFDNRKWKKRFDSWTWIRQITASSWGVHFSMNYSKLPEWMKVERHTLNCTVKNCTIIKYISNRLLWSIIVP